MGTEQKGFGIYLPCVSEDGEEAIFKVTTSENLRELWNNRSCNMQSLHKYQAV